MTAPYSVSEGIGTHFIKSFKHFVAVFFKALSLCEEETEHSYSFGAENVGNFNAVLEIVKMGSKIVGYFDFAVMGADGGNADSVIVKDFLQFLCLFHGIQGNVTLVKSTGLNMGHTVGFESGDLFFDSAARFVGKCGKIKCCGHKYISLKLFLFKFVL